MPAHPKLTERGNKSLPVHVRGLGRPESQGVKVELLALPALLHTVNSPELTYPGGRQGPMPRAHRTLRGPNVLISSSIKRKAK